MIYFNYNHKNMYLSNNKQNTPISIGGEMNVCITKFTEAIAIL